MMCGGYSHEKLPDDESNNLYNKIKDSINHEIKEFVSYKTQVVNGTNYLLKLLLTNNTFIFVKVYKDLNNNIEITDQNVKDSF